MSTGASPRGGQENSGLSSDMASRLRHVAAASGPDHVLRAALISVWAVRRNMAKKARRRYVTSEDAAVTCAGRWGRKRVTVSQCCAVLAAEDVYTRLLRDAVRPDSLTRMRPGASGYVDWSRPGGHAEPVGWELRPNAVWRFGRLFLTCPRCLRRATRVYVPTRDAWIACRRCWGLTYGSRRESYRGGGWLGPYAYWRTDDARARRVQAAKERGAERRAILAGLAAR
jgi:hypothetical protein